MENLKDLLDLMGHGEVLANQRVNGLESGWEYLEIGWLMNADDCTSSQCFAFSLGISLMFGMMAATSW